MDYKDVVVRWNKVQERSGEGHGRGLVGFRKVMVRSKEGLAMRKVGEEEKDHKA